MPHPFSYTLKTHPRAKNLSIRIKRTGEVIVTKPKRVSVTMAEHFVERKKDWIIEKVAYIKTLPPLAPKISRGEYKILREKARILAEEKIKFFNSFYKFSYKNISIKNQKTRWGSCSAKGNLNFNYRIALLTPEQADYIIVHELCHLKEMNHGKRFWDLVKQTIPDYKKHHVALRKQGLSQG